MSRVKKPKKCSKAKPMDEFMESTLEQALYNDYDPGESCHNYDYDSGSSSSCDCYCD